MEALDRLMQAEPELTGRMLLEDLVAIDDDALEFLESGEVESEPYLDAHFEEARRRRRSRYTTFTRRAPRRSKRLTATLMRNVPLATKSRPVTKRKAARGRRRRR